MTAVGLASAQGFPASTDRDTSLAPHAHLPLTTEAPGYLAYLARTLITSNLRRYRTQFVDRFGISSWGPMNPMCTFLVTPFVSS